MQAMIDEPTTRYLIALGADIHCGAVGVWFGCRLLIKADAPTPVLTWGNPNARGFIWTG